MPHVLIIDLHSSANRGDAAIFQALMESLAKELPESIFKVHSTYPCIAAAMHNITANTPLIKRPYGRIAYIVMIIRMGLIFILAISHRCGLDFTKWLPNSRIFNAYKDFIEADLIVGMGGGFYNDNYYQSLPGRLFHLFLGKTLAKPVVISAHSVGPFNWTYYRWMAQFVFRQIDLICLRDRDSLNHLALMDLKKTRIEVVADSAWLLRPSEAKWARETLEFEHVPLSRPLVSVSLFCWRFFQTKPWVEGHQQYLRAVAKIVTRLIEQKQFHVVFLSTCTDLGGNPTDDRRVAKEILELLDPNLVKHTTIIKGEYKPEEIKSLYGQMHLHIGTRMHSVILAAAMKTPVVGIAYEFKMVGVMRELGLDDYVCDIEEITEDKLWQMVSSVLDRREELKAIIDTSIPALQRQATRNAQLLAEVFKHRG